MSNIRLHNVHYVTRSGTFEARVDVKRGDTTYRYPCSVTGPATMDIKVVSSVLSEQALRMSDTNFRLTSRF